MTARSDRFVEFYLQTWNASEAARKAGYKGAVNRIGSKLLTKVDIRAKIAARMAETAMQTDEVLTRLSDIARLNIGDFLKVDEGKLQLDVDAIKARGHLVKKITPTKFGLAIEVEDRLAALVKIGETHRMFVQRTSVENPDGSKLEPNVVYVHHYPDNGRPAKEDE